MSLYWFYKKTMTLGKPLVMGYLNHRLKNGKEDPERFGERMGLAARPRPEGVLLWVHVASVGEAQSMLSLIALFLHQNQAAHVMVTSVTRTSAELLEKRLPPRAFHHYIPVDRPKWVQRFLDHWQPTMILWAESELWPVLLHEISKRHIPAALLNARMSPSSFRNWLRAPAMIESMLRAFTVILTQSDADSERYTTLGARSVVSVGNIKFAAPPLPFDDNDLKELQSTIGKRPVWLYASTHAGEEELALDVHRALTTTILPDLLTIIVPRHPERRDAIAKTLETSDVPILFRGNEKILPHTTTGIYVADTLGELGLFYRLSPLSVVGRSFSTDGGGGHNPLEPAQLGSAVLHGPLVQNLLDIYAPMDGQEAAIQINTPDELIKAVGYYLTHAEDLKKLSETGYSFAKGQQDILNRVVMELEPVFLSANCPVLTTTETT